MTGHTSRPILPHVEGTLEYLEATSTFFGGRNWEPKFVTVTRSALVVSKTRPAYEKGHYLEQVDLLQVGVCEASIEGSSKQHIFQILGPGIDRSFACKSTAELEEWVNKLTMIKQHWTRSYQQQQLAPSRGAVGSNKRELNGNATKTFELTFKMDGNIEKIVELPKQSTSYELLEALEFKYSNGTQNQNYRLYCVSKHGDIVRIEKNVELYPFFKAGSSFFLCEQQQQQQSLIVVHFPDDSHVALQVPTSITSVELQ